MVRNTQEFKIQKLRSKKKCTWNVRTLPVKTQTTGTISKPLTKYLSNTTGSHESKELQKTVTLANAHVLQKVLMSNFKPFNMGNNSTCAINFSYR